MTIKRTDRELEIADAIDEMNCGDTLWIGDHSITRMVSDTELYTVDDSRPLVFYEAWQAAID